MGFCQFHAKLYCFLFCVLVTSWFRQFAFMWTCHWFSVSRFKAACCVLWVRGFFEIPMIPLSLILDLKDSVWFRQAGFLWVCGSVCLLLCAPDYNGCGLCRLGFLVTCFYGSVWFDQRASCRLCSLVQADIVSTCTFFWGLCFRYLTWVQDSCGLFCWFFVGVYLFPCIFSLILRALMYSWFCLYHEIGFLLLNDSDHQGTFTLVNRTYRWRLTYWLVHSGQEG